MTKILRSHNNYFISEGSDILDNLPINNFMLELHPLNGFYLIKQDDFILPSKIYGDAYKFTEKVLKTYNALDSSMGVFLSGLKGTGKSLTSKVICKEAGLPVITICDSFSDSINSFKEFMGKINFSCIIFIDEFEKIFDSIEKRNIFLSILDGNLSSKKLFIFTSNDNYLGDYFENRLKRIRYHKRYTNIEEDIIDEIIEDNLINKYWKEEIKTVLNAIGISTMDILISLIEEINIHDSSPLELIKELNITNENDNFEISYIDKENKKKITGYKTTITDLITQSSIGLGWIYLTQEEYDNDKGEFYNYSNELDKVKKLSPDIIHIEHHKGLTFILERNKKLPYSLLI